MADAEPRIHSTVPDFQRFAGLALDADPGDRAELWETRYREPNQQVFDAFYAGGGARDSLTVVLQNLEGVRARVQAGADAMPGLIAEVEPRVAAALGLEDQPSPLHVLMAGTLSVNALVTELDGGLTVLHCLEWFNEPDPARVLLAHESTHAWHRRVVASDRHDLLWTAFYEGLAVRVSRTVVPDRPEDDYFWYGIAGFEDWLEWCREHEALLFDRFRAAVDDPEAAEAFFGGGFVEEHWRTGFFVADHLVGELEQPLDTLVRWEPEQAVAALQALLEG